MLLIELPELPRLLARSSSDVGPTILTGISVAALFLLSQLVAHRTIVYRRNNEGAFFSLALAGGGFYAFGYLGLLAFIGGTVVGAWSWVSRIKAANERLRGAQKLLASES